MQDHRPAMPGRARRMFAAALAGLLAGCGSGGGASAPAPAGAAALPAADTSAVAAADPGSTLQTGWQHGAFAEIFVRSYQDSDGDGIGDLRGLTSRLDYLHELGISGIWLMPVTRSQDHDHGYAVTDYRDIERDYGSLADFDEFVAQAHARGIGVIVDYVVNHSAAQHALFVNAKSNPGNAYRDWYLWQAVKPTGWSIDGQDPWRGSPGNYYFAAFSDQMPDFDLTNPAVVAWHHDNLRFWLNRGVDGFRFDAVGNLVENGPQAWENQPQNYALLRDARTMMNGYAQRFLVCEGPSDPFGYSAACGSAFAFNDNADLVAAAKGDPAAAQRVAAFPSSAPPGISMLLSNHDSFAGQRPYDQFGGNVAPYKLAAATYLLQPGTPFIYYGEEIGMAGAATLSGDARLRTPMSWTAGGGFTTGTPYRAAAANLAAFNVAAEQADPASLLAFYKAMLALRRALPSIAAGSYENAAASGSAITFQRHLGSEHTLVAINYGTAAKVLAAGGLPANTTLASVHPPGAADVAVDAGGTASITLDAQAVRVFVVR